MPDPGRPTPEPSLAASPAPPRVDMRFPLITAVKVFVVAVVCYVAAFGIIEHLRHRNGSWVLTFQTDSVGIPSLRIDQAKLGIQGVVLRFPEERHLTNNLSTGVQFDTPQRPLPFGVRVFEDLTFLPGVETLDVFGHEIELAPRVLVVDRKEIAWTSTQLVTLASRDKIPLAQRQPPKKHL